MFVTREALPGASDVALAFDAGRTISRPRQAAADSFVLHAPLELAARLALLPNVALDHRDAARHRVHELALGYEASGPSVDDPDTVAFERPVDAARALTDTIDAGDLEGTDAVARAVGTAVDGVTLRTLLADAVVPRLAAAAHGSILLHQLPRVAPRGELSAELLRPLARELARYPDWRLAWIDELPVDEARGDGGRDALFDVLAATPHLGSPGSDFIFPVMHQVDDLGTAAELLRRPILDVDAVEGARAITRAAAWSMLREPETHTPYGWTHCLTLPQAVLGVAAACASPRRAMAVAATYVVGFRAAFATEPLIPRFDEPDPGMDLSTALDHQPSAAAAAVWHAERSTTPDIATVLATRASIHADAHYVKYTLACLDAAHADAAARRLHLTAAARLAGYWAGR